MEAYYTHQQYLREILNLMDYSKPIKCLEFGSGIGSSSIFNEFCKINENLNVTSFESDLSWLKEMESKYSLNNYKFKEVNWTDFNYEDLKKEQYDLIFVDQGDWDARIITIDELKNNSTYFILHDYCYYNGFRGYDTSDNNMIENSVDEGTYFHDRYSNYFDLTPKKDLFPPTLILKRKNENNNL
ncbi:hypothetical protein UFOVP117_368 [uncultured Caudovirales phage]|uniref:Uncharacterized protein n=1 Tax=uncultured Caudovirales phage TaxID=2100421 RepID=A0A6J5LAP8_9CAUD|nr:hypothetical protein UFOVP117_368 [uncultured Caudovirales phage]